MSQKFLKVDILSHTEGLERVIAAAGKLCYSAVGTDEILKAISDDEVNRFVGMLARYGHLSPLEHVSFTFTVEGISRACSHQIVRHRIASFSQQSQRYVPLEDFSYIIPPAIDAIPEAREVFIKAMEQDQDNYDELKNILFDKYMEEWVASTGGVFTEKAMHKAESAAEKKAIEDARYVFPNACETKMVFTMNVRTLYNFFEHRCCDRAQWEIRELADGMLSALKEKAPMLFRNIGPRCIHGICPEGKMSCGKQGVMITKYHEHSLDRFK